MPMIWFQLQRECDFNEVISRIHLGVVPGEGKTNIHVTFTPMEYVTAHMTMQLSVSQFNTTPLVCDVTASCQPPAANQLAK